MVGGRRVRVVKWALPAGAGGAGGKQIFLVFCRKKWYNNCKYKLTDIKLTQEIYMPELSTVEDTLFVPMLGRIYATENFPNILNDKKALELKAKLPENLKGQDTQTQYTLMASAVRSTNMDRYVQDFMKREPEGVVVQLGCGLETTFYRNDNGHNKWYEVDLPDVILYRRKLLEESERDKYIAADGFEEEWIKQVRAENPDAPIMVMASGLFYYFSRDKVVGLFSKLKKYGQVEMVFDAVNGSGMKQMSKYMKQVGHEDANMYFYVDNAQAIAYEVGDTTVMAEEPYYMYTPKKGLKFMTSTSMKVSDMFSMVKMIHLKFN